MTTIIYLLSYYLGPPPPPSAVSIVHHDLETINISWTAVHSAFNVTTSYNVYTQIQGGILNIVGFNISDPYLLYSPAPICGTTNFRIYSSNPAGLSSQYIQKGFSSLISEYFIVYNSGFYYCYQFTHTAI